MLKSKACILAASLCVQGLFAVMLPTGQNASVKNKKTSEGKIVEVTLSAPVTFSTSVGDLEAKANSEVEFYESGALKSLYSEDTKKLSLKCGTVTVSSNHTGRKDTGIPFEFHEDGSISAAFVSRRPSDQAVETPAGRIRILGGTRISFFEDGSVEACSPCSDQKIRYGGLIGPYAQGRARERQVSFYRNGNFHCVTSEKEEWCAFAGIKVKKATEIEFSESTGEMISFCPAENSQVKLGELTFLLCKGQNIEFYDSKKVKSCTVDVSCEDFAFGKTMFAYGLAAEKLKNPPSAYLRLDFAENGTLLHALALKKSHNDLFPIVCGIGDRAFTAAELDYYDDGNIRSVRYARPLKIGERIRPAFRGFASDGVLDGFSAGTPLNLQITKKYTSYNIWKVYFSQDGSLQYLIGIETVESPKDSFAEEQQSGIFTIKGDTIADAVYDKFISAETKILLDDSGRLDAYTTYVKKLNDEVVESVNKLDK